ncbi:MAG: pyruvate ferredoxin oxidoreductase, partial [Firmicutes bacterium]|nr:pyruvate ferredoxin oxidoreductase [Bacillota bacterium]
LEPEDHAVICNATSCMEVSTFTYPYSSWTDSYIHNAFENAAATAGGVEAAYNALKKKGKIDDTFKFIAVGGDGGTYDIGFQSLSGAMERNHDMVYVCYDNEAYMNTGIQRSSATPMFADTTTTPAGKISDGKPQNRKDITEVIAAHHVPYVAQTTFMGNFSDLHKKAQKAIYTKGACFLTILAPCPRGWRYEAENVMDICKAAADTCFWPMYEVEYDEKWTLNYKPKNKLPIEDFLKLQGRFKHLLKPGKEEQVAMLQAEVDRRWEALLKKCEL